ncbi:GNAT family N-acetyltransferase [Curtobacterium sp. CFBP9011]|uniref:GNAT family N-acetyltransferase n=1 Tax=Curtobacterium sp. CFBP9011 TaxID=3096530 RepID=UPI002A6A5D54|nr:GNAT family N-acetyltransferase [Curtobacterium sp. CFBP9011]MDY1003892.1 GNAT family N-acetyltransferase [Curtobacterium sp. CFBP9011]
MSPHPVPVTTPLSHADVLAVERAEAEYFRRFLDRAPTPDRERLGISTASVRGGVVAVVTADPSRYWTKALGFGADGPVDDTLVAEVVDVSTAAGATEGVLAIAPAFLPTDWSAICERHGLVAGSRWAKSVRAVDTDTDDDTARTDLPVRRLTVDDVPGWARIIREAFGMTEPDLSPMLRGAVEDPVAHVFGAFDGDLLVGAAALHVVDGVGSLNTGGTLPSHRGRGVQSALIAARAAAARAAGCRLLTAETGGAETDPSYRNLGRAGFVRAYHRVNWRWTA